jgi:hypothetical protein
MDIADTVPATLCNEERITVFQQFTDRLFRIGIGDTRSNRNLDMQILALVPRHLAAHAVLAATGAMQSLVTEIDERIQTGVGNQIDTAAIPAIAPVRTTPGNIFLATKTRAAVAPVTGFHFDVGFVDKFHAEPVVVFFGPGL